MMIPMPPEPTLGGFLRWVGLPTPTRKEAEVIWGWAIGFLDGRDVGYGVTGNL